ncbi:hypothetical protein Tco_1326725 [Tanacetum coccineum]
MDEQAFDNELDTEGDKKDGENRGWEDVVGDLFLGKYLRPHKIMFLNLPYGLPTDFMHHHNGSYIMFGDMNAVRNAQERFGTTLNSIEADHFNSFIDSIEEWEVADSILKCHESLPPQGIRSTIEQQAIKTFRKEQKICGS